MHRAAVTVTVTVAAAAAAVTSGLAPAPAAEVDLNFAHFMPAGSWQHQEFFTAWEQAVEEQSGGRIDVTIFPAQTLGKAPQGYDNARTGVADIAWTVQGYTAGRFPLSHIVELPGLFETAEVGSCAFQKLYDSGALDGEYGETHVLFVHTHGPGHLHTQARPVTTLAGLKGLKIRHPTQVIGELLQELGAEPVGMPAPQIYESMQRGSIDGYMLPWEAVAGFRVHEVSDHHTEFGFYSLAFVLTMNRATYEGLPDDLRQVVDANSGLDWALRAGRGFDEGDRVGREVALGNGTLYQIEGAERAEWEAAAERTTRAYLAELERQGLPGGETYERVKGYVAECQADLGG
ncbi:MAG TPA: TRAP transporter substrate-binding protein [Thermohalobaculum sp.]|nr:TRAP transporter substrate-binding protein [Thermohalobaculum sp.]